MNLNPMSLNTTGIWSGNYVQPDTTAKVVDPKVATYPVGGNPLLIVGPQARFIEPLSNADDPHSTLRK
jgi:hypothetical protein